MKVQTLFFAAYRDVVGSSALDIEVPEGATVDDLVRTLRSRGAPFDKLPEEPAVAVNHAYSDGETVLSSGDEVALIPPVAGG